MKNLTSILLLGLILATPLPAATPWSREETLALRSAQASLTTLPRWQKFELNLDLAATYDNPFDPGQVDVYALFTPPSGKTIRVNGFLDQPFTNRLEQKNEVITPAGSPAWKIRFTPRVAGAWRYQVFARDRSGSASLPPAAFQVTEASRGGFIQVSPSNPRVFAREDGSPFFLIGENMCWGGSRGSFDYVDWLPALARAGGNWIRIWMSSWNCALEWSQKPQGDWRSGNYHGVGVYSLDNAWKLDRILDLADQNGISVMLAFGTYGEFNEGGYFGEGQWKVNPYNSVNGGPCQKPEEFWTNERARQLYRQRLRYIAARYGWRTNIQSWEFWNEAKAPASWVAEMARCLKGTGEFESNPADPHGHLVSTTYGNPEIWRIPEIDFSQTHHYGKGDVPDHAPVVLDDARQHASGKPHLLAEFGIDWRASDTKYDAPGNGVNLHNALWASACSGDAGTAMIWWWDSYVHPKNIYAQFEPLKKFLEGVPWTRHPWEAVKTEIKCAEPPIYDGIAPVRAFGLTCPSLAILWVHNTAHQWKNVFENKSIPVARGVEITISSLPASSYQVETWDTWKGIVIKKEKIETDHGRLVLPISDLPTDVALRLSPAE